MKQKFVFISLIMLLSISIPAIANQDVLIEQALELMQEEKYVEAGNVLNKLKAQYPDDVDHALFNDLLISLKNEPDEMKRLVIILEAMANKMEYVSTQMNELNTQLEDLNVNNDMV